MSKHLFNGRTHNQDCVSFMRNPSPFEDQEVQDWFPWGHDDAEPVIPDECQMSSQLPSTGLMPETLGGFILWIEKYLDELFPQPEDMSWVAAALRRLENDLDEERRLKNEHELIQRIHSLVSPETGLPKYVRPTGGAMAEAERLTRLRSSKADPAAEAKRLKNEREEEESRLRKLKIAHAEEDLLLKREERKSLRRYRIDAKEKARKEKLSALDEKARQRRQAASDARAEKKLQKLQAESELSARYRRIQAEESARYEQMRKERTRVADAMRARVMARVAREDVSRPAWLKNIDWHSLWR